MCWSYAREWCELQQSSTSGGVEEFAGPLFISIGDGGKLDKFLELNPFIPRDQAFVDGYEFSAYNAVGFGSFDAEFAKGAKVKTPQLGGIGQVWKYLTNVMELSPIEDPSAGIPEGVKRLGGTFVVNGDDVVYQWSDRLPGDTPELSDVLKYVLA
mmetsp:Transcript_10241/g.14697  ORF Transcript_10241/g.14697 Transcript_10241/m.14697 type:complete len:155 (+) Transcript_10241:340-804(+)